MDKYSKKLRAYIEEVGIEAEVLDFGESCHSVEEAAAATDTDPDDHAKSICMIDRDDNLIVAIVGGKHRVDFSKITKLLNIKRPRFASPEEILERTGYPCGGTPPMGYQASFLIDKLVMNKDLLYAGGGSRESLLRVKPEELHKANKADIQEISK